MMYWENNSGADHSWYNSLLKKDSTRKYFKYFRQKDTLMAIPKILEEDLKAKDEDTYNDLVSRASRDRSKITIDEIVKTYPESAAIVVD